MPGCPCGSSVRAGQELVAYVSDAALQALIPSIDLDEWAPLVSWLLGQPIDVGLLCISPPPTPPAPTPGWFVQPWDYLDDLLQVINAVRWPLFCACDPCPPVTTCAGGTSYTLGVEDGYFEAGSCYAYKFHLVAADVYMQATGCACAGHFGGDVFIQWNPPQNMLIANPNYPAEGPPMIGGCGGVTEWTLEFTGSGAGEHSVCNTHGSSGIATIWQNGGGGEPNWPWPKLPTTVEPLPSAPVCTEEAQCEAIDYLGRTLTELIWQTAIVAEHARQTSETVTEIDGPYSITIPGLSGPITGSLAEVLPKLFVALAPPTLDQLTQEWTEEVTATGTLDITGAAVLELRITDAPAWLGQRGLEAPIYLIDGKTGAPGFLTLQSELGVIERIPVQELDGRMVTVHPMAVVLTYDLGPGVMLNVTAHSRAV